MDGVVTYRPIGGAGGRGSVRGEERLTLAGMATPRLPPPAAHTTPSHALLSVS
jgi:hypothetical protein